MIGDTHFERYLPEPQTDNLVAPEQIRRHILCSGIYNSTFPVYLTLRHLPGQIYYTLVQEREQRGVKDVAISRLEQLSPFPYDLVRSFIPCRRFF